VGRPESPGFRPQATKMLEEYNTGRISLSIPDAPPPPQNPRERCVNSVLRTLSKGVASSEQT
jgi:hypothetical protein